MAITTFEDDKMMTSPIRAVAVSTAYVQNGCRGYDPLVQFDLLPQFNLQS